MRNQTSRMFLAAACLTWVGCNATPPAQDPAPVGSVEIDLPVAPRAEPAAPAADAQDAPARPAAPTTTGGLLDTYRADTRENVQNLEKNLKHLEAIPSKGVKGADASPPDPGTAPDPDTDDDGGSDLVAIGG